MKLKLSEIQPGEPFLRKSCVEFFRANPGEILKRMPPISIAITGGLPFKYYVREGNNRLFVLYSRGLEFIELGADRVEKIGIEYADEYGSNLMCYWRGIRSFGDLKTRIIPDSQYPAKIQRYLNEYLRQSAGVI